MILLFTENEKIWMRKMPNDKNIIDGKIYKIYMQMYDPDEIDIPWWGTCNLWVRHRKKGDKEYAFVNLRAAELCLKWLEKKEPHREFKIVESEE
jgi:hypothetical protein